MRNQSSGFVLDSSVIAAIMFDEPLGVKASLLVTNDSALLIGAPNLVEVQMVATARGQRPQLENWLSTMGIIVIPFAHAHAQIAIGAFERYGRGRHKASLNYGDCMAYATAKVSSLPLLYVGNDFALTDLEGVRVT